MNMNNEDLQKIDFTIIHKGDGQFEGITKDGEVRNLGPSICGMIRYTYFEDYTIPPIGWTITNSQLITDYFPKASKDIMDGRLKPNEMNY